MKVAVVDIGSNSLRLFLCTGLVAGAPEGERMTTVTALRRGAADDGTVTDAALERLDACLRDYGARLRAFAPDAIAAVGTSAVRDAPNRGEVVRRVRENLGTDLVVLTGPQEAEMSYTGARLAAPGDEDIFVVDIGGGSTEIVRGDLAGPRTAVSLDIGSVRCTDTHLNADPPTREDRARLVAAAADTAGAVFDAVGRGIPMIGVAGTITTLAAIAIGEYDRNRVHGARITRAAVEEMIVRLGDMPLAERRAVPGLHPDRAPAVVAGACIAAGVMDAAGADHLTVSERDLLDGVALRLTPLTR